MASSMDDQYNSLIRNDTCRSYASVNLKGGLWETFSPIIKPCTIRVVLTFAITSAWPIRQLDIQNSFLNGFLTEEEPRAWYTRLSVFLQQLGFLTSREDSFLFIRRSNGDVTYLLVYVDDIILTCSSSSFLQHLIDTLHKEFALKDIGELSLFFLGVEVTKTSDGLFFSQHRCIEDLFERANMQGAKPVSTPFTTSIELSPQGGVPLKNPTEYRSLVGGLQYLLITRPELAFPVNKVCQFLQHPTDKHLLLVNRILRYLQGTCSYGLTLRPSSSLKLSFQAYTDADWAGDPTDRRSTSGYCVYLGSNIISWSARKHKVVSKSSTEAGYRGLAIATAELIWIESLLKELQISVFTSPALWCDNLGATYLTMNPIFYGRTKHIKIDYHFVRERVQRGQLIIHFVCYEDQIADIFTKHLSRDRFSFLRSKLTVTDHPLRSMEGVRV
ncbi:uncharacterized protein LOC113279851 [Papaver somniferum]|uniref:uncharacterized protein LOC113279851 n=1 Tax=Papaver somniferum TaxID=3469 RepID=UPI000E70105B|nr:uncharacterized protein LOC113279851 [Papaver somniferum]